MIPKIIHSVWLSGDDKPELYQSCINSWHETMPDYDIKEWNLTNLPDEILNHQFVKGAIQSKKWAYATDVIRLWLLKEYGGIYLDMDVFVYRRFDCFLNENAFSCLELNPAELYESVRKSRKELLGIGIEAGVLGAEKGCRWITDIYSYYQQLEFINDPRYYCNYIMPRVQNRVSVEKYGFRQIPVFQVLKDNVIIYPSETFSWIYKWKILGMEFSVENVKKLGEISPMRYACHLTLHSWWDGMDRKDSQIYKFKHWLYNLTGGRLNKKKLKRLLPVKKEEKW